MAAVEFWRGKKAMATKSGIKRANSTSLLEKIAATIAAQADLSDGLAFSIATEIVALVEEEELESRFNE
jgi:hypothetical protein